MARPSISIHGRIERLRDDDPEGYRTSVATVMVMVMVARMRMTKVVERKKG